ncbi:hypothetical protein V6N13_095038 [Hibiscus sabdariffa]|uniref:Transmembrane protein n=1 Tax=Hibiscus sabdariffa TaxID=183260 RepID=A0ABR2PSX9_9ROSI
MNQLLDSPLEALAFNYVSFGIFTLVNNLWTWVAVVTAALSFWRIRAAACSSGCVQSNDPEPSTSVSAESRPVSEVDAKPSLSLSASVVETTITSDSPLVCRGVTKGGKFKLTVYYDDDGEADGGVKITGRSDSGGGGDCKCNEWWESWERVLRLRNGETGWYRCQDLTALNGNVVRLWDESWRRW